MAADYTPLSFFESSRCNYRGGISGEDATPLPPAALYRAQLLIGAVPDAACTCGEEAPIIYQGSHVNPSGTDPRGGFVMVCAIPDFCHPDAIRNRDDDHGKPVNFLRLSVREDPATYRGNEPGDATVVLTREQVVEMHDTLARWLDVHPAPTSEVAPAVQKDRGD